MKIVHVYKDSYPPLAAGITRYLAMVASAAVERGHQVEVHVAGVRANRHDVLSDGVVVYRWAEYGRVLSNPLSPALLRAARRAQADVLHLHMPNPIGELGALSYRGPVVSSFHAQLGKQRVLGPVYAPLQQRLLRRSSSVLVASPSMLDQPELLPHLDRCDVLPYGVDPRLVGRDQRPPVSGTLRLLFVGRLVYYKGLDILLDAVAGLGDVQLTVIGEGALRAQLARRVASDPVLAERVSLRGLVTDPELARAYREHDVFVAPSTSRAEAFGISMAEALSNGMPAISTRLGTGTDWVNEHEVTGLVIEPNDAAALRVAIDRLRDDVLRQGLSQGARDLAAQRFSADCHIEALLKHYEQAVS